MSKDVRIITVRVDIDRWEEQEKAMVPGSSIDTCRVCEQSVWLSPDGHRFAYEIHTDDSEIVCSECHIRLEIERRKEDEHAEPIPTHRVPGPVMPPDSWRRAWEQAAEQEIQEGVEGGPSST